MTETAPHQPLKAAIIPVTPLQQNCTLIWDRATGQGAVIDPGGDVEDILDAIHQAGITVETIFLTHGHIDHVGGAEALKTALGGVEIHGPHIVGAHDAAHVAAAVAGTTPAGTTAMSLNRP